MFRAQRPGWHKHKLSAERKGAGRWIAAIWRDVSAIGSADTRPLIFAFCLCAGAVAYFNWPSEPPIQASLAATAATAAIWLLTRRARALAVLSLPALVALAGTMGFAAATVRAATVAAPVISRETGPVMVEGWVTEIEPGAKGARLRLELSAVAGMAAGDTPHFIRLTHRTRLEVAPGRFVRCWAVMRPPPAPTMPGDYDFRRQAWFEQLGAVGYVQGRCRGGALGRPASALDALALDVSALRRRLAEHVRVAAGERAGGFAAALISGDRSFMDQKDQEALRASGLSHLLAISGLHMSIVGGLVFLIVRRGLALVEPLALRIDVQKPAAIAALAASLAYLVMSGASVSTQRAFIMLAVVFGAVLADRAALSLRSYAIAMSLVVLLQPESVVTPGFQMSFAATGALIATYDAWTRHRTAQERVMGPFRYAWASLFVTSAIASLATAPFAIYHFDRVAGLGLVANLLAMPIVTFVSAPLAAFTALATPFGFGDLGLRLFGYSLEAVLAVAHACAGFEPASWTIDQKMPPVALGLFSAAIALAMAARGWGRLLLIIGFTAPALGLWAHAPRVVAHWSASGDVFVHGEDGTWTRYALAGGDGLNPLRYADIIETDRCAGPGCTLPAISGTVMLIPDDTAPNVTVMTNGQQVVLDWAQVQKAGGATILSDRTGVIALAMPLCHDRPWQACPSRSGVPAPPDGPG